MPNGGGAIQARAFLATWFGREGEQLRGGFEGALPDLSHLRGVQWQVEKCPESGRLHVQAYLEFSKPTRPSSIQAHLPGIHLERRRGSAEQARDYCSKEESRVEGPYLWGTFDVKPGKRNDLLAVKERLDAGVDEVTLSEEFFGEWCRHHKAFKRYSEMRLSPRQWKTQVHIRWGVPGSGKTSGVYRLHDASTVYPWPRTHGDAIWADGYSPNLHDVVLLDDFYGWLPLNFMLLLMDEHPMQVQVKGGFLPFRAKELYITSNRSWDQWYDWFKFNDMKGAFERRINSIEFFDKVHIP